jgi:hypothetical protein
MQLVKERSTGKIFSLITKSLDGDNVCCLVKDEKGHSDWRLEAQLEPLENQEQRVIGGAAPVPDLAIDEANMTVYPTDNRLNLNSASVEQIIATLQGVSKTVAKKIVSAREGLSGGGFASFEEVKRVAPRVNWQAIQEEDLVVLK